MREVDGTPVRGGSHLHLGQQLVEEEAGVGVPEAVVLEAPVVAVERGRGIVRVHDARRNEYADDHRQLAPGDQVVQDDRRVPLHAVLVHEDAGRLRGNVLARDVDGDLAPGARENPRVGELEGDQVALRDAGLRHRVGPRDVAVRLGEGREGRRKQEQGGQGGCGDGFHGWGRCGVGEPPVFSRKLRRNQGWTARKPANLRRLPATGARTTSR